jgi:SAM-dependent methyltransferase
MKKQINKKQIYQNCEKEIMWHRQGNYLGSGHWTSLFPFASQERHWLHNDVQKIRFYGNLQKYNKAFSSNTPTKILIAPVGNGADAYCLRELFPKTQEIHGIDISPIALNACPRFIVTKEADILNSGYEDQSFDIIVCSQFLHHVHEVGFEPFIVEFYRLLRKDGVLTILEPSSLYPFGWVTAIARNFIGNVTGLVEGEHPVRPRLVTASLRKLGFRKIWVRGLLYSHVRFPTIAQHIIDSVDFPLRFLYPFKLFANSIAWYCLKP